MQTMSDSTPGHANGADMRPMSDFAFACMSLVFQIRDLWIPPVRVLTETGMRRGQHVLDFGCGPGSHSLAAASMVGPEGRVIALDAHPLAIGAVLRARARRGLPQIEAICSDCATGAPDASVDVVLLFDIFHMLGEPDRVLRELHRVLKSDGLLSFSDHHMKEERILRGMTSGRLFSLRSRGRQTYSFAKT